MRTNALILFLAAWASSSCGGSQKPKGHDPASGDTAYEVSVWVQPDARMSKDVVMKGCGKWSAKRVTCVEAPSPEKARIRVYADDGECVIKDDKGTSDPKDDETHYILAWAYQGGKIRMMMKCLHHDKAGVYDDHQFGAVVTHEVGHQLGIWQHVPRSCKDEDAKTHAATGRKICGPAVMNPYYHKDIDYVTEIDALAFDERDRDHTVLLSDSSPKDTPDCVYEAPAP